MTTRLPRFEGIAERDGGGLAADHGHGAALLRFITVLSMLGGGVDAGSEVTQLNLTRAVSPDSLTDVVTGNTKPSTLPSSEVLTIFMPP